MGRSRTLAFERLQSRRLLHHGEVQDFVGFRAAHLEDGVYVQLHTEGAHVHADQIYDAALTDVWQIDQRGSGSSTLELAAGRVARISRRGDLAVYQDRQDELRLTGDWQLLTGQVHAGEYMHRLSDGEATVQVSNARPWQNPLFELDVDGDRFIDAQDVQAIANHLNREQPGEISDYPAAGETPYYVDTTGDQLATSRDVLLIVNHINSKGLGPAAPPGSGHVHGTLHEVPAGVEPPAIDIEVTPDRLSGWNLSVQLDKLKLTPERVSTAHVFGEGHLHLYVDGQKMNRLYATDYFLGDLTEGVHQISVEVSGNDHAAYAVDGVPIRATRTVQVPPPNGSHHHPMSIEVDGGRPVPDVHLNVTRDPVAGWNVRAAVSHFRLSPENVSATHVAAEGHMHLYIDGVKRTRLYDEWYHIPDLSPGTHTIMVELSSNNHGALTHHGLPIADHVEVLEE